MKSSKAGITLAVAFVLALFASGDMSQPSHAAKPSQKQLLAICRAKYGNDVSSAVMQKNGQIVCQEGPGREATRNEVFEWCKKKFSATTVTVQRKGGRWHCRYYGRY